MQDKNISSQSSKLLSHFHNREIRCFNFNDAYQAMSDIKHSVVRELLSDMTRRGLLMRLRQGVYYIIPYEADSKTYMPDWHIIAEYLVYDADYYIGYYSALQIHNLITQPSLKEQIVVSKQIRPSVLMIKEVPFQFIYHNENHFFGMKKVWIDSFHKVKCSDIEKTIIDCLYRPDYAGGIVEIIKAIYQTKNNMRYETLLDYAKRFKSPAVIKRLGFLLEMLKIEHPIINDLLQLRTTAYVLLDPELPSNGKYTDRWRIRVNIDVETLISAIYQ